MNLNYSAALATMQAISEYTSADFEQLGILPADYKLAASDKPWIRDNRRKVVTVLDALLFGTLDVMGLPRIAVPSEYVAAIVSTFVAPSNRMTACLWLAEQRMTGAKAMDLASRGAEAAETDPTAGSQLFALVCLLSDNDSSNEVRQKYLAKMTDRVRKAVT